MSGKHHLVLCSPPPHICEGCVAKQTTGLSISLSRFFFFFVVWACFFILFFKFLCCCPLTGLRGSHFLGGRWSVYLPECIFKGAGEADIIPAPAALAEGESPVAPCRAAMSIVCLHTEWPRALCFPSSENEQLITTRGPSGNLCANQENSLGSAIMLTVIKGKKIHLLGYWTETAERGWNWKDTESSATSFKRAQYWHMAHLEVN